MPCSLQADDRIERAVDASRRTRRRTRRPSASRTTSSLPGSNGLPCEHRLAVFVEDVGHRRAGAEEESQAGIVEDLLHARGELVLVGGEIEPRRVVAVVRA